MPLATLLQEVAEPHRNFGIAVDVRLPAGTPSPMTARNPAILYGLGNLLENAVDFARDRVEIAADWTGDEVQVVISDDGPGFAPEVIGRIGEPYVRSRQVAADVCIRRYRHGARLFHRQDAAGADRRQTHLYQPVAAGKRRHCCGALAARAPSNSCPIRELEPKARKRLVIGLDQAAASGAA